MRIPNPVLSLFFFAFVLLTITFPLASQSAHAHTEESHDSGIKKDLHDWFVACKAFYQEIGPDHTCTLSIAEEELYGLVPNPNVVLHGWGLEQDFCVVGWHRNTNVIYAMNAQGTLMEMGVLPVQGELSIGKPQKIWIYEEFPPSKMAFLLFGASVFLAALLIPFSPAGSKPGVKSMTIMTLGIFLGTMAIYYFNHSSYLDEYVKDSREYSKTVEAYIRSDHGDPKVFCQAFPGGS